MTDPTRPNPADLDAYLDNALEGAARQRVEQAIATDPQAAAEVRIQREIDQGLHRLFDRELAPASIPIERARRSHRALWLGIAAAAAIAVSAIGIYSATVLSTPRPDVGAVYLAEVSTGFKPQEVCTTPEAFKGWVNDRYGEPLTPTGNLEGIRFVGWSYANVLSGYTGVLLAEVDQKPVVVVLDKASREDRRAGNPTDPSLHMFRRAIGGLVLYEVTPHASARILPVLTQSP